MVLLVSAQGLSIDAKYGLFKYHETLKKNLQSNSQSITCYAFEMDCPFFRFTGKTRASGRWPLGLLPFLGKLRGAV